MKIHTHLTKKKGKNTMKGDCRNLMTFIHKSNKNLENYND